MRIAMIGTRGVGSNYGGIERCLDALCPHLVSLGHEVDVYCAKGVSVVTPKGIRNLPTVALGGKHFSNLTRSAVTTLRALGRYDVLHFHASGPGILTLLCRLSGVVSVATVHALDQNRAKWGMLARGALSLAERVVIRSADEVTVVSSNLRDYFEREYERRVSYIPNGIAPPPRPQGTELLTRLGLEPQGYLLFAGRMTPEKGGHDLIQAFNRSNTQLRLLVAGGNGPEQYIQRLRASADPSRVVFAGHLESEDLACAFTNAHSFILPSYIEGMSLSLLEAISYGLPLLVSDIPENRVVCGDAPLYFRAGAIEEMRSAIELFGRQPSKALPYRVDSGLLARWDQVALNYEQVYERALAKRLRPTHARTP
jgi:glycosyltransferase involved in cell wall biosynthesis